MNPATREFHNYLTTVSRTAPFASAVGAVNYAVEGVAQKISEKALRGLGSNEKIGPRGRWWLEEHAKYDDEHPIHALEIIKSCVGKTEEPDAVTAASVKSLMLMRESMVACYEK
jgi:pyrroloquinoline quinone (PQQ) biosynthesis protein C